MVGSKPSGTFSCEALGDVGSGPSFASEIAPHAKTGGRRMAFEGASEAWMVDRRSGHRRKLNLFDPFFARHKVGCPRL